MELMRCGHCGGDTVRLRAKRVGDNRHAFSKLEAECMGCGSRTAFEIPTATIVPIAVGDSVAPGSMCIGWSTNGGTEKKQGAS